MKFEEMINKVICGDCLEIMKDIPNGSIDLVLTDPPYGITQNKWDKKVDLTDLFRIANGIIITSQQPFATEVIHQFKKKFKYDLIWDKVLPSGMLNANRMPLRIHELILIFGKVKYNPQKVEGKINHSRGKSKISKTNNYGKFKYLDKEDFTGLKFPKSILKFEKIHPSKSLHPTQKPVALMEYLIKTYSNENDLILDPFLGSGTTAVAAKYLQRRFIGIEISEKYCEIARKRLLQKQLF